ncbi:MAG TPA: uracil-DNA glycosylase family protein [Planctomycetota bacterium]|nr:uracil-DNA glycosylase family protein [Planctomycetota bacterium]
MDSKVLFVAEAPGRLGADRTGIPLCGDRAGDNFETLLGNIGWRREDVFITNAVLCNPKQENGNNATPTPEEIANCSAYLEMVVNLVDPDVIATMGAAALDALGLLLPHGIELREGVAQLVPWRNTRLFPLYHPASRAIIHRSLLKQRADFMLLAKAVHPAKGLLERKKIRNIAPSLFPDGASPMQQVVRVLLELGGRMTYFKMTKLMYLIDLLTLEKFGHTVASDIYLRQVEGPWPPDLSKALEEMNGYEVRRFFARKMAMVAPGPSPRCEIQLGDDVLEVIFDVFRGYGSSSNAEIKTAVYRTDPMRFILQEESKGRKMTNKPVIYKNKTARELANHE